MWRALDLRSISGRPDEGRLVALCLVDRKTGKEEYRIGKFSQKGPSTKLWWEDCQGIHDPVRLRKQNDIWWSYTKPFTRGEFL